MRATVYQHPRSPVMCDPPLDPRDPPVALPRYEQLTEDEMALLDAVDVLERLADRLGTYRRVSDVLKTVAMIHGEAL